jgi:two-component system, OmpR family, sensor kinase
VSDTDGFVMDGSRVASANLMSTSERHLATLERLLDIQPTDLKVAMDEVATLLAEMLGTDKVDAFLHEPETDTLVAVGASRTPMGRHQRAIGLDRQPVANGGRAVEVFQGGEPYMNGRVEDDACELIGVRQRLGVRSQVIVALDVNGARRGTLAAQSAQTDFFRDQDLRFLQAVSRWVGSVVHRAELAERTEAALLEKGRRIAADELVTILAHDLRNYLTPIGARVQLLSRRAAREHNDANVRELGILQQTVDRFAVLISELLDVARLDQGLFTLSPQPLDLAALAHELAERFSAPGRTAIRLDTPPELHVVADPARLRQALDNLLANAEHHSPDGVAVTLGVATEARDGEDWAVITVRDEGPGIQPDLLPRLFDRFAKSEGSDGIGLGLHLAQQIAKAHGGTLEVRSSPGAGTTFRLLLPVDGAAT